MDAGSRKDALEVRNLAQAILEVEDALQGDIQLTEGLVRHWHQIILRELNDANAGQYRRSDVAITGAKIQPPLHVDVPPLVASLVACAAGTKNIHIVQKAAWLHWAITRIHPFLDGNGRIARLLQDYILLQGRYVPAPLRSEDRDTGAYYSALESADQGDGTALLELVAKNALKMADRYVSIMREEDSRVDWVAKITKTATEKVTQTAYRRFLAVQRTSTILKNELLGLCVQLGPAIPGLTCRIRDYGDLDFDKFQEIERSGSAKRTWQFGLLVRIQETELRFIFWYGSHHPRPYDPFVSPPSPIVILISQEEEGHYRLLDELGEDRIGLRELIPRGTHFMRRRWNPVAEKDEWDFEITAGTVARDFLQEVLGKLGVV